MVPNRKYVLLWMMISAGVFFLIAGLALAWLNRSSGAVSTPMPAPSPTSGDVVKRISLEEAKKAFDQGTAVFVDVRDAGSYEISHIPGALLIPVNELVDHLDELNPSSWIITYCT